MLNSFVEIKNKFCRITGSAEFSNSAERKNGNLQFPPLKKMFCIGQEQKSCYFCRVTTKGILAFLR